MVINQSVAHGGTDEVPPSLVTASSNHNTNLLAIMNSQTINTQVANLIKQATDRFNNAKRELKRNMNKRTITNLVIAEKAMWAVLETAKA